MKNTDIIRDKLNILDVVGSYVKLEKAGKTYKGKSPFTNEKTPSFFVSPEKGFFYCFSSQKGGDIFTFIQEIERVDFKDALKILAEKAGVRLDDISLEKNDKKSLGYKILDDACRWYEVQLRKTPEVIDYLLSRGLKKETIIKFRIGYVPEGWQQLYSYLKSKKYSDEAIAEVGLITKKKGGNYYDRFRSRVMFPLMDTQGRVVGFSGRIFGESDDGRAAKYVNSPEGPYFNKSHILFGYSFAKHDIRTKDACLLVEGQFDVIMCQQSGYINTVAISGTGLTDEHIKLIKRFSDNLLLALDSDAAGIKATRRSVLTAYRHGMNVRVVSLPAGMDPADTIAKSKEQFSVYVHDAKDYFDYRIEESSREELSFKEKKSLVEHDLFTFIYLNQSAIIQDKMLQKIALFLGVSIESVRMDFARYQPEFDDTKARPSLDTQEPGISEKPSTLTSSAQSHILYLLLYLQDQGYDFDKTYDQSVQTLYTDIYESNTEYDLQNLDEVQKNIQLFILNEQHKDSNESFLKKALIRSLQEERLRQINQLSNELLEKIRNAEAQNDDQLLKSLTQENNNLKILKNTLLEQFET